MLSSSILLMWIAFKNRGYPLLVLSLAGIFINKAAYNYFALTWRNYIFQEYIGHALILIMAVSLVRRHRVSAAMIYWGMAAHVLIFIQPQLLQLLGSYDLWHYMSWPLRYLLAHVGLYIAVLSLYRVPAPNISGPVRRRLAEPAHILAIYAVLLAVSDIIMISAGGKVEYYIMHVVGPNLFIAMLFAWVIGMYVKREDSSR